MQAGHLQIYFLFLLQSRWELICNVSCHIQYLHIRKESDKFMTARRRAPALAEQQQKNNNKTTCSYSFKGECVEKAKLFTQPRIKAGLIKEGALHSVTTVLFLSRLSWSPSRAPKTHISKCTWMHNGGQHNP